MHSLLQKGNRVRIRRRDDEPDSVVASGGNTHRKRASTRGVCRSVVSGWLRVFRRAPDAVTAGHLRLAAQPAGQHVFPLRQLDQDLPHVRPTNRERGIALKNGQTLILVSFSDGETTVPSG